MRDGAVLLGEHHIPTTDHPLGTVLIRTPYGRRSPLDALTSKTFAARGYHVLVQSVRGTFGSGGVFDPMVDEERDGHDTVAWLRQQPWFDGRLATYGLSYLGFVQWALAQDPPPELAAAVIQVGPHDFSRAAYHHGAFDLQNFLGWSDMVAHQETTGAAAGLWRMVTSDRRLRPALNGLPVTASGRHLLGTGAPWFEGWLEHPDLGDPFWAPLQRGAALTESLAWLDRYAGPGVTADISAPDASALDAGAPDTSAPDASAPGTSAPVENSVRVWMGGKGAGAGWREVS